MFSDLTGDPRIYQILYQQAPKKWLKDFALARLAQKTVVIVETNDPYRKNELATVCRKIIEETGLRTTQILLYDGVTGIDPRYSKLSVKVSSSQITLFGGSTAVPYSQVLSEVGSQIEDSFRHRNVPPTFIVILTNIDFMKNNDGRLRDLEGIINNWIDNEYILQSYTTLVIFTANADPLISHIIGTPELIKPPISEDSERYMIIKNAVKAWGLRIPESEIQQIVNLTRGLTLEQVDTLITKSNIEKGTISAEIISNGKRELIKQTNLLIPYEPKYGFDNIGGYYPLKRYLKTNLIDLLLNKDKDMEILDLKPIRGLLFLGPPGTGKTLFARAIAKEAKIPFFELGNVFSKWLGESEANINRIIRILESLAPAVLFIDEIDALGRTRSEQQHETRHAVFSRLLSWLGDENRRTIIIGTTNVPEMLDSAFKRAGRFDNGIYIGYPDLEARIDILKVLLFKRPKHKTPIDKNLDLKEVAKVTDYYTGAELEEVVRRAKIHAYQRWKKPGIKKVVTMEDFDSAILSITIDINERRKTENKYIEAARELRAPRELLPQI